MQCFQCLKQIDPTEDIYRLESDPYHIFCEECATKPLELDEQPEKELDYIIETYCTKQQKLNLIKSDPIAYPYFVKDRLSDMHIGRAEDYMEVG